MKKCNPDNERIKHKYFEYLKEARRRSDATVDAVAKALSRFEIYTGYRAFKSFRSEQAVGFKKRLAGQLGERSGKKLSKSTLDGTLAHLKAFFLWLAGQPGFKSRLQYAHAEFFNLSEKETRIARARRDPRCPTMEQVVQVVTTMSARTDAERRDRAVVAFIALTGIRIGAAASLKMKHVDLGEQSVFQDARQVRTKFSKTSTIFFFPVSAELIRIVTDYVTWLRIEKLWGNDDPLFPKTQVDLDSNNQWAASGNSRDHWSDGGPIRGIFRAAFKNAQLPYFHPHSLRHMLAHLGEKNCQTPEEFKAWSQNLSHEGVLTTFLSYGEVSRERQAEIMRGIKPTVASTREVEEVVKATILALKNEEASRERNREEVPL